MPPNKQPTTGTLSAAARGGRGRKKGSGQLSSGHQCQQRCDGTAALAAAEGGGQSWSMFDYAPLLGTLSETLATFGGSSVGQHCEARGDTDGLAPTPQQGTPEKQRDRLGGLSARADPDPRHQEESTLVACADDAQDTTTASTSTRPARKALRPNTVHFTPETATEAKRRKVREGLLQRRQFTAAQMAALVAVSETIGGGEDVLQQQRNAQEAEASHHKRRVTIVTGESEGGAGDGKGMVGGAPSHAATEEGSGGEQNGTAVDGRRTIAVTVEVDYGRIHSLGARARGAGAGAIDCATADDDASHTLVMVKAEGTGRAVVGDDTVATVQQNTIATDAGAASASVYLPATPPRQLHMPNSHTSGGAAVTAYGRSPMSMARLLDMLDDDGATSSALGTPTPPAPPSSTVSGAGAGSSPASGTPQRRGVCNNRPRPAPIAAAVAAVVAAHIERASRSNSNSSNASSGTPRETAGGLPADCTAPAVAMAVGSALLAAPNSSTALRPMDHGGPTPSTKLTEPAIISTNGDVTAPPAVKKPPPIRFDQYLDADADDDADVSPPLQHRHQRRDTEEADAGDDETLRKAQKEQRRADKKRISKAEKKEKKRHRTEVASPPTPRDGKKKGKKKEMEQGEDGEGAKRTARHQTKATTRKAARKERRLQRRLLMAKAVGLTPQEASWAEGIFVSKEEMLTAKRLHEKRRAERAERRRHREAIAAAPFGVIGVDVAQLGSLHDDDDDAAAVVVGGGGGASCANDGGSRSTAVVPKRPHHKAFGYQRYIELNLWDWGCAPLVPKYEGEEVGNAASEGRAAAIASPADGDGAPILPYAYLCRGNKRKGAGRFLGDPCCFFDYNTYRVLEGTIIDVNFATVAAVAGARRKLLLAKEGAGRATQTKEAPVAGGAASQQQDTAHANATCSQGDIDASIAALSHGLKFLVAPSDDGNVSEGYCPTSSSSGGSASDSDGVVEDLFGASASHLVDVSEALRYRRRRRGGGGGGTADAKEERGRGATGARPTAVVPPQWVAAERLFKIPIDGAAATFGSEATTEPTAPLPQQAPPLLVATAEASPLSSVSSLGTSNVPPPLNLLTLKKEIIAFVRREVAKDPSLRYLDTQEGGARARVGGKKRGRSDTSSSTTSSSSSSSSWPSSSDDESSSSSASSSIEGGSRANSCSSSNSSSLGEEQRVKEHKSTAVPLQPTAVRPPRGRPPGSKRKTADKSILPDSTSATAVAEGGGPSIAGGLAKAEVAVKGKERVKEGAPPTVAAVDNTKAAEAENAKAASAQPAALPMPIAAAVPVSARSNEGVGAQGCGGEEEEEDLDGPPPIIATVTTYISASHPSLAAACQEGQLGGGGGGAGGAAEVEVSSGTSAATPRRHKVAPRYTFAAYLELSLADWGLRRFIPKATLRAAHHYAPHLYDPLAVLAKEERAREKEAEGNATVSTVSLPSAAPSSTTSASASSKSDSAAHHHRHQGGSSTCSINSKVGQGSYVPPLSLYSVKAFKKQYLGDESVCFFDYETYRVLRGTIVDVGVERCSLIPPAAGAAVVVPSSCYQEGGGDADAVLASSPSSPSSSSHHQRWPKYSFRVCIAQSDVDEIDHFNRRVERRRKHMHRQYYTQQQMLGARGLAASEKGAGADDDDDNATAADGAGDAPPPFPPLPPRQLPATLPTAAQFRWIPFDAAFKIPMRDDDDDTASSSGDDGGEDEGDAEEGGGDPADVAHPSTQRNAAPATRPPNWRQGLSVEDDSSATSAYSSDDTEHGGDGEDTDEVMSPNQGAPRRRARIGPRADGGDTTDNASPSSPSARSRLSLLLPFRILQRNVRKFARRQVKADPMLAPKWVLTVRGGGGSTKAE